MSAVFWTDIAIAVLVPLLISVAGFALLHWPQRFKKSLLGFHTSYSLKNENNWTYAQKTFGRVLIVIGLLSIVISEIVFFYVSELNSDDSLFTSLASCIILFSLGMVFTEYRVRRFDHVCD
jgi:uncharacterized membrane protein